MAAPVADAPDDDGATGGREVPGRPRRGGGWSAPEAGDGQGTTPAPGAGSTRTPGDTQLQPPSQAPSAGSSGRGRAGTGGS